MVAESEPRRRVGAMTPTVLLLVLALVATFALVVLLWWLQEGLERQSKTLQQAYDGVRRVQDEVRNRPKTSPKSRPPLELRAKQPTPRKASATSSRPAMKDRTKLHFMGANGGSETGHIADWRQKSQAHPRGDSSVEQTRTPGRPTPRGIDAGTRHEAPLPKRERTAWERAETVDELVKTCASVADGDLPTCREYVRNSTVLEHLRWTLAGVPTGALAPITARYLPEARPQMFVAAVSFQSQQNEYQVAIALAPVRGVEKAALRPAFGALVQTTSTTAGLNARVASVQTPCLMIVPEHRWREAEQEISGGASRTAFVNLHVDAQSYQACVVEVE